MITNEDEIFNEKLVTELNEGASFSFLYHFKADIHKSFLEFEFLRKKSEDEK